MFGISVVNKTFKVVKYLIQKIRFTKLCFFLKIFQIDLIFQISKINRPIVEHTKVCLIKLFLSD